MSVDGAIQITGVGGDGSSSAKLWRVDSDIETISSSGRGVDAATITIDGTGGEGTHLQIGVLVTSGTTEVTSVDGAIQITGAGGDGNGNGSNNIGVELSNDTLSSTGTGPNAATITITAPAETGPSITTVWLTESSDEFSGAGATVQITSIDGAVQITGIGGDGSGNNNHGVNVDNNGTVQVTNASLQVTGTATGGNSNGVLLDHSNSGQLRSVGSGSITVTADGNGTGSDFRAGGNSVIGGATATGDITINADSVQLQGSTNVQSSGALTIQPRTPTTTIGLGGGSGDLNLDDTELGLLAVGFSSITIGDATSGDIDIDTATFNDPLNLITGGEIHDGSGTDLNMANGDTDTVTADGTVAPGQSPGTLIVAGNFAFADNSTFEVEIGGVTAGTHDQIDATGAVSIGSGVTLDLVNFGGLLPFVGESFTIINRAGGTGTFDGLPEGATISGKLLHSSAGIEATITYEGGDGDDVVLTVVSAETDLAITVNDGQTTAIPGDDVTYTIFVTNNGPRFAHNVSIEETLPASLTGVSVTGITPAGGVSGVTDNSSANNLNIEVADFPVDGQLTITVTGTIDSSARGSLAVTASVIYGNDPDASNNSATDTNSLVEASSLIVTTDSDVVDNTDFLTSLREAIAFANLTPDTLDEVTFGGDGTGGTTNFTDATPDVITLGGTELSISSALTITGPGADLLTVSGNNASRVFNIATGNHDVTLDSLTIADGNVEENGGGIKSRTTSLTVVNSAISGNFALLAGGGIYNHRGSVRVTSSTISGNSASFNGGGGIYSLSGSATVTNSTISGNSTSVFGGGIGIRQDFATVTNSTISGNSASSGGGIAGNLNSTTLNNSIVSGNTADVDPEIPAGFNGSNNVIGGDVNLILDPILRDNGGPTLTHALVAGSPAIDMGDNDLASENGTSVAGGATQLATDQRGTGFDRILGGTVDIGAFEGFVEAPSLVVTTDSDAVDNTDFLTSLREAIAYANIKSGADTITFDASVDGSDLLLTRGQMTITEDVTITGNGTTNTIIDAQQNSRVFDITNSVVDVTLNGMTLQNGGMASEGGGAVRSQATGLLTIEDSLFQGNSTSSSQRHGGAISASHDVVITGSTFDGNFVSGTANGGAIHVQGGTLDISDSTFTNNSTRDHNGDGGAIFSSGALTVTRSTISDNFTTDRASRGGAIFGGSSITILASTLSGNSTAGDEARGGAIFTSSDLRITNSTLSGNSTAGDEAHGGATFSNELTITNSTLTGNSTTAANADGGAIYTTPGDGVTLYNSIVAGNTAGGTNPEIHSGGGLSVDHSLIGDATGTSLTETGTAAPDANGNFIGGSTNGIIDPMLGALQDNGGPTFTHALLSGSPAIDAGDDSLAVDPANGNAPLPFDQRGAGFDRSIGSAVDIGAFELPLPVQTGPQLYFKEVLDERVWLGVNDISPDGIVVFAWGTEPGETYLPAYGVTLGIANPTLGSLAEGGIDGTTSGIVPVPFTPDGQAFLFQAFELAPNPQVTNVLPLNIAGVPVVVSENNEAPESTGDLPSFTATVGKPFDFDIADDPFVDPDSDAPLFYNARQTDGSPLPDWLSFDAATLAFHSDSIPEAGDWSITVTATDNGSPVRYSSTTFILQAVADRSIWQNESDARDVNSNGKIEPVDALIVINRLNNTRDTTLTHQRIEGESLFDVNGDQEITPIDALQVINWLNLSAQSTDQLPTPSGEFDDEEASSESKLGDTTPDVLNTNSTSKKVVFASPSSMDSVVQSPIETFDSESEDDYEDIIDAIFGEGI